MQDQPLRSTTADPAAPGSAQDHHGNIASTQPHPSAEASADASTTQGAPSSSRSADAGEPPSSPTDGSFGGSEDAPLSSAPPYVAQLACDLIDLFGLPDITERIVLEMTGNAVPRMTVSALVYPDDPRSREFTRLLRKYELHLVAEQKLGGEK